MTTKTKTWECPLCGKKVIASQRAKQQHLIDDINHAQDMEADWYQAGLDARTLYRKMFNQEA